MSDYREFIDLLRRSAHGADEVSDPVEVRSRVSLGRAPPGLAGPSEFAVEPRQLAALKWHVWKAYRGEEYE